MKYAVSLVILIFSFLSCKKAAINAFPDKSLPGRAADEYISYIIRKGAHYCENSTLLQLNKQEMHFKVIFDSTCIYTSTSSENKYDINKLYGFTDGGFDNHVNSARFGWNWNGKQFDLHAYCYVDGKRLNKFLTSTKPGDINDLSIKLSEHSYVFNYNGGTDSIRRATSTQLISGYQQFPYFGGDETAPREMIIRIKDL